MKLIGITLGDANGVGPEILLRSFQSGFIGDDCIAIGDAEVLHYCSAKLGIEVPIHLCQNLDDRKSDHLNVIDLRLLDSKDINIGKISGKVGEASLHYVAHATKMALAKELSAIVTLPVNKEAIRYSDADFSGHTGFIAEMSNTKSYTMMLVADELIVTHISTHVALSDAIKQVNKNRIKDVISLTATALSTLGKKKIAVAGLNPHAGEHNAFGNEDSGEIAPAVQEARSKGFDVVGPIAPDTVFYHARKGAYDAVVCMYHDQGHIPIKLLAFESAVNVTLGLPFVRTSVDHGTAFDIAYQGKASLSSFHNALELAKKLC